MTYRIETVKTGFIAVNRFILLTLLLAVFCTGAGADADGPDY